DVATGKDREDLIKWVKFSGISWAKDGSGFYYSRYAEPAEGAALTQANEFQKLYFHKLGTPQAEDVLVYERKDQPRWGMNGWVTEDGTHLIIHLSHGTDPKKRVAYKSLKDKDAKIIELLPEGDASYDFIGNHGGTFYFLTDLDAPNKRVIAIDTAHPERENWKEIIPQASNNLDSASMVGGKLICSYMKDARDQVIRF